MKDDHEDFVNDLGNVLVVDDEEAVCKICGAKLQAAGYQVKWTTDPHEALRLAAEERFDLLLTDVVMPEISGLEIIHSVRQLQPQLAVVIMTGFATLEMAIAALKQGADNFIHKPFRLNAMMWAVDSALERRNLRRENLRLRSLVNLHETAEKIRAVQDASSLFNLVLAAAVEETGANGGGVFEWNANTFEVVKNCELNFAGDPNGGSGSVYRKILQDHRLDGGSLTVARSQLTTKSGVAQLATIAIPCGRNPQPDRAITLVKTTGGDFSETDLDIVKILVSQAAIALDNTQLALDNELLFLESIKTLATAIDERDPYMHGHSKRVGAVARRIGEVLHLSAEDLGIVELSGNLHDVGKIGIRDEILLKPAKLTPEEYEIIKTHPERGANILCHIRRLSPVVEAVRSHHEWYDGNGYPYGLAGDRIPLSAAIISVADAFDTITNDRPYCAHRTTEEALHIAREKSGTQFHPEVVEAFCSIELEQLNGVECEM